MSAGTCTKCGESTAFLTPLHGDKGGPLMCLLCAGAWHAEHGKRRKWGRIVAKAIKAYFAAGGTRRDIDKLCLVAWDVPMPGHANLDTIGADIGDITSELLSDTPSAHASRQTRRRASGIGKPRHSGIARSEAIRISKATPTRTDTITVTA